MTGMSSSFGIRETSTETFFHLSSEGKDVFRNNLVKIARTTLSSKDLSQDKDYFANLVVNAVLRLQVRSVLSFVYPFSLLSLL
jgi:T-complex protein 1 subunit beta